MSKKGFTLIELIIVVIIIGILAAIAAPMMAGNVRRARMTEAQAALGAIRTAERLYWVEKNLFAGTVADLSNYINVSDLNGTYFDNAAYGINTTSFIITATGDSSGAAKHADVAGYIVNMNLNTGTLGNN